MPFEEQLRRGRILAAAPSAALPAGLFHRVVKITQRGDRTFAFLASASVWEAFPTLDIHQVTPLSTSLATPGAATTSGFDDVDISVSKSLIGKKLQASCGAPPTGWTVSPSGSLHSWITSDLHRRYKILPYGRLSLTVKGNVGLAVTLPTGVHCGISIEAARLQAAVLVFGVPVPVTGSAAVNLDFQTDAPASGSFNASLTATAGIDLNGRKTAPVFELRPQGSGSFATPTGVVTLGPEFQAGIGISELNAHFSVEPRLAARASRISCQIDLGLVGGVGLDAGPLHASYNPLTPSTPIFHCPLPDGVFFDGSPGTGPPPPTLGPYAMTPFGADPQSTGPVSGVAGPAGGVAFPAALDHLRVDEGWATWSHGYRGDVYVSDESNTATVNLPAGTRAFYLYAEPNVFADFNVTVTSADGTSSGPVTVYGESGAAYFGFYATGSKTLSSITVRAEDLVAIGEFGIAR